MGDDDLGFCFCLMVFVMLVNRGVIFGGVKEVGGGRSW